MCGIFGIIVKERSDLKPDFIVKCLESLALYSIRRGRDSSGIVFKNRNTKEFDLVKGDIPIKELLKSSVYKSNSQKAIKAYNDGFSFEAFGHARLVTNGSQLKSVNNQPVVKDGIIALHNGIIVNADKLWELNPNIKREFDIDTEVFLALLKNNLNNKIDLKNATNMALNNIEGSISTALSFTDRDDFVLATNNGSLYYIIDNDYLIFASEEFFLSSLIKKVKTINRKIIHLKSRSGLILNTKNFSASSFSQDDKNSVKQEDLTLVNENYLVKQENLKSNFNREVVVDPLVFLNRNLEKPLFDLLEDNQEQIKKLKRCSKCILPFTFPFIDFDEKGVCNYCRNHKPKVQIQSFDKLKELVEPYRKKNGAADCIVPFSGGRDSTYSLHIIKKELKLNPIAFTYDWGMVTDLARRNIARACGKLGVENIIVSANINWKRENIKKNITAWLKKPELGMIPLFMAGDKYFFYYCDKIKKETGIDLNIWGINDLENTNFKTGFSGLSPKFDKKRIYSLSIKNQLKLFGFVSKNLIQNPGYINQSMIDSFGSFAVRYFSPKKDYFHLFDYYKWDEKELESLIKDEYQWETAIDTKSTWRIGDGTASFYNYIYNTVAGFTENDTFRSNQIREGLMTRDQAMNIIYEENKIRYETLRWYLEIIGLNFSEVISVINKIPKLYKLQSEELFK